MKKIIFCLAVCAMAFGFYACKITYRCRSTVDMPHNLKPISCEDFNDVPTMYWNLLSDCNEIGVNKDYLCDTSSFPIEGWGRTLLIEGWGRKKGDFIILCPDSISATAEDVEKASNYVNLHLHWPGSGGIVADNSVDFYHIICSRIWHDNREWCSNERIRYRIELWGAILHFEDPTENYINEKKEVENEE